MVRENDHIYIPTDPRDEMKCGFGEFIFQKMKENGNNIAQIDCVTGQKETYASLLSRSIRTAQSIQAKGLVKGDVMSLCSFNNMDYSATIIASYFLGVHMSPFDPTAPLLDILHCLKLVKPKILFCETHNEDLMDEAIRTCGLDCELVVFGDTKTHVPFAQYLLPSNDEANFRPAPSKTVKETSLILFSSGTTGLPKAVCVNQYSLYFTPLQVLKKIPDYKVILTVTNPYWISNILMMNKAIVGNSARVIYKCFDANTAVKILQDYQVDLVLFTPVNYNHFIKEPSLCQYDTSKLKYMVVGGSATTYRQHMALTRLFPHTTIYQFYGTTEIGGLATMPNEQDAETMLGKGRVSLGNRMPGHHYKVVDVQTEKVVGPNEPGELRIKSDTIMLGYYKKPDLTGEAFDSEGYFKTGDEVYYDEEYNFYYVDRLKEIFKYKGWHISPTIIESELMGHPDVKECAVFGTPDQIDGELATAAVVLRENAAPKTEQIIQYTNERLPDRYLIRGGLYVLDNLPRTTSGKVKRNKVRQLVMNMVNN